MPTFSKSIPPRPCDGMRHDPDGTTYGNPFPRTQIPEATLTAAEARLDACLSAHAALAGNLERLGMLPVPGADTALDDLDDLVAIVGAKLRRAWTLVDDAISPIRAANDDLPEAA